MKKTLAWILYVAAVVALCVAGVRINDARDRDLGQSVTREQKQSEARMAAKIIETELRRFEDITVALAARQDVGQAVAAGDWEGAMDLIRRTVVALPDIDRVTLLDLQGVLRTDFPVTTSIRGKDFSFRDWYLGVTSTNEPYVSEVYRRAGVPRINVISVAAYVYDPATTKPAALLMMQIPASKVYGWSTGYDFGRGTSVTFVDRNGNLVQETREDISEIISMKDDPAVQRAMRQMVSTSIETGEDGVETLVTQSPVEKYKWSVVLRQPVDEAMVAANQKIGERRVTSFFFGGMFVLISYVMIRVSVALQMQKGRKALGSESSMGAPPKAAASTTPPASPGADAARTAAPRRPKA